MHMHLHMHMHIRTHYTATNPDGKVDLRVNATGEDEVVTFSGVVQRQAPLDFL